jgi:alkyl hydroperoxide reductase subunit D
MMSWVDNVKEALDQSLGDAIKDIKLNLDAVILRSTLSPVVAQGCALAAAVSAGNGKLAAQIAESYDDAIHESAAKERAAAFTAASLMAMTNVWYPYVEMAGDPALKGLPPSLRMNAIMSHGGTSKINFEAYSLAASIVGKCHFCVKAHYDTLKKEGMTVEQLRDIGRIAAVVNSVAKVLSG